MSADVFRRQTFAAQEVLFRAGDPPGSAFLIQAGSVAVSARDGNRDVVLAVLQAGDLLGEMALLNALPRSATATAREPTTCIVVTPTEFSRRLERSDALVRAMLKSLAHKLRGSD